MSLPRAVGLRAAGLRISGALAVAVALMLLHPWFAGVGLLWRFLP